MIRGLSDGDDVPTPWPPWWPWGAASPAPPDAVELHRRPRPPPRPGRPLDCGNSGTGLRLLAGVVAGLARDHGALGRRLAVGPRPWTASPSPCGPWGRRSTGQRPRCLPPVSVTGGPLHGIDWQPPVASAQVKSAILLAGLSADGQTAVREPVATRAHTEELLAESGADISVSGRGPGPGGAADAVVPAAARPHRPG